MCREHVCGDRCLVFPGTPSGRGWQFTRRAGELNRRVRYPPVRLGTRAGLLREAVPAYRDLTVDAEVAIFAGLFL
jgi:hypothetical protein